MANVHKGEVDVTVDGKTYTMVFAVNGICDVEDKLGRTWIDIADELNGWRPKTEKDENGKDKAPTQEQILAALKKIKTSLLRTLIWGALREHHREMTIEHAGSIMNGVNRERVGGAYGLVAELFGRANPESSDEITNPPKPGQDGTGQPS